MNNTKQQSILLNLLDVKNGQGGQWRLVILFGLFLPLTLLIIIGGLSYLFIPISWKIWLLLGGGLFLLGLLTAWITVKILPPLNSQAYSQNSDQQLTTPVTQNATGTRSELKAVSKTEVTELQQVEQQHQKELPTPNAVLEPFQENGLRYRQLIELSPYMIVIIDQDHTINFINNAGTQLLQLTTPLDLTNKLITDFVHPTHKTNILNWMQQVKKEEKIAYLESKFIRADHTQVTVELTGIPFEEIHKTKSALQLVIRDITKRKHTEAEIIQRNHELTILQEAGVAITSSLDLRYVLDTVSHEMTKLINTESCTIFEWQPTDNAIIKIAQYNLQGWWDSQSRAEVYDLAKYPLTKSVLEDQIPEQLIVSQADIDPAEFDYMQTAQIKTLLILPMIFQRRVLGLVRLEDSQSERIFTYQEISMSKLLAGQAASAIKNAQLFKQAQQEIEVRQRAEAALEEERALLAQRVKERTIELRKANAELARASRLKDEFLANMSHELRTPLNTILGSAEILYTNVFGELNEKQEKYARNVDESGQHLLSLINDILDLAKIETGKIELTMSTVPIEGICQASLRLVKQLAHKKQLILSTAYNNSSSTIPADERRLKQMLINLLSNAIKFTPQGGKVGLEVDEDTAQQFIYFTVWDSGIGIASEDIEQLFEPFVQVDSKLSRQYEGTGLGLSLVSQMAKLHGGQVSVESVVGEGSRFTISFPYNKSANLSAPVEAAGVAEPYYKPEQIITHQHHAKEMPLLLLVDDNEDNISMLVDFLRVQKYRVLIANSGREALEQAKAEKPDMIMMDIQMPDMDGLEATRQLRKDIEFAHIPIIAVTALAMTGDRERCLQAGANDYLSKPVSPMKLLKTIETYLTL